MDIDWDTLSFGFTKTDYMFSSVCTDGENFVGGEVKPFGNIELSPASGILNYAQVAFCVQFFQSSFRALKFEFESASGTFAIST